jgi:hypothetical protein
LNVPVRPGAYVAIISWEFRRPGQRFGFKAITATIYIDPFLSDTAERVDGDWCRSGRILAGLKMPRPRSLLMHLDHL